VQFVVYDDQSMPATAVRLYEKLITEDKVDAIMGPYSSPVTEAAVNVTEKYKKVMVAPLAATTSIFKKGRKYIFMVISPAEVYLEGLVDMAAKRGLKTVAVVNEDTLFSKAAAAGAVEIVKKKGLQVVFAEAYRRAIPTSRPSDQGQGRQPRRAGGRHVLRRRGGAHAADEGAERQSQDVRRDRRRRPAEFYDTLKQNAEYIYGATQWETRCRTRATPSTSRRTRRTSATSRPTTRRPATPVPDLRGGVKRANSLDATRFASSS